MTRPYVIVWDLDGTIGVFKALNHSIGADTPVSVEIRPGMAETLQKLSRAGFVHTVLTLATPTYAEAALRGTNIRSYFDRVEGRGQRGKGDAAGLGDVFGLTPAERPERMLFIGDIPFYDQPADVNVVFHLETVVSRPADDFARLVLGMRDAGRGSIRRGFEAFVRFGLRGEPGTVPGEEPDSDRTLPIGRLVRSDVQGVGPLLMCLPENSCPIVGFGDGLEAGRGEQHHFVPTAVLGPGEAGTPGEWPRIVRR